MHSSMIRIKFVAFTMYSFGQTMARSSQRRLFTDQPQITGTDQPQINHRSKARSRSRRYGSRILASDQPQITGTSSEASVAAPGGNDGNDGNGNGNGNANENATTRLLRLHHRLMIKRVWSGSTIGEINRVRREVHASPEWQLAIRQGVLELQRRAISHGA